MIIKGCRYRVLLGIDSKLFIPGDIVRALETGSRVLVTSEYAYSKYKDAVNVELVDIISGKYLEKIKEGKKHE